MSKADPRRPGFRWLTPSFLVKHAQDSIDFYNKVFGFEVSAMHQEDGTIMHVIMKYHGQHIIMFIPEDIEWARGYSVMPNSPHPFHLYVDDVDEIVAKAKSINAEIVKEPHDAFWGDRYAEIKDVNGYIWGVAYSPEEHNA